MKSFGPIFAKTLKENNLSVTAFAEEIGIGRGQAYNMRDRDDVDAGVLEKFCRYFKINPMEFFDDDVVANPLKGNSTYIQQKIIGDATMNVGANEEIKHLRELLEEKERMIQLLLNMAGHPEVKR